MAFPISMYPFTIVRQTSLYSFDKCYDCYKSVSVIIFLSWDTLFRFKSYYDLFFKTIFIFFIKVLNYIILLIFMYIYIKWYVFYIIFHVHTLVHNCVEPNMLIKCFCHNYCAITTTVVTFYVLHYMFQLGLASYCLWHFVFI